MIRSLAVLVGCAAVYGFCIGASNSWLYAQRNLWKVPLMILTTSAVCGLGYFVLARTSGAPLGFRAVQRFVLLVFRDVAILLAALSPAVLFLALTMQRGDVPDLAGYAQFQGFNVLLIALCGCIAVVRETATGLSAAAIGERRRAALVAAWMAVSLLVGAQAAWYMRPFFGLSRSNDPSIPYFSGTEPDSRGARSFYEACYNLVVEPVPPRPEEPR